MLFISKTATDFIQILDPLGGKENLFKVHEGIIFQISARIFNVGGNKISFIPQDGKS